MLLPAHKTYLLGLARKIIESKCKHEQYKQEIPQDEILLKKRGAFVTLHKKGELRGCIGYIIGYKPMWETIQEMAIAAAFQDPRFSPVQEKELEDIEIEISVLTDMIPVTNVEEIEIGRDGLYIVHPRGSGLLLPQVATEWGWDKDSFLRQVCKKAGLASHAWKDSDASLYRFMAIIFSEKDFK